MLATDYTEFPVNYLGPHQKPTIQDPYATIGFYAPLGMSNPATNFNYGTKGRAAFDGYYGGGSSHYGRSQYNPYYDPQPYRGGSNSNNYSHYRNGMKSSTSMPDWVKWTDYGASSVRFAGVSPNMSVNRQMSDLITSYF